jgi:tetratricopeptide (TPR) repeat protein
VLDAFLGAAEGIAAAHHKGIVHRDIKPSNILMGSDGRARVLDFGLARKLSTPSESSPGETRGATALEPSLTAHGAVLGTPAYMAPEQHDAAETDERTDQYAFCISLYEALHGERPFRGKHAIDLAAAKRDDKLPAPPQGRHVPRWLRDVLARGLSVDPKRRYPDMQSLISALRDDPVRKWGRRGAMAGTLAVLGGLGVATYQARAEQTHACDATAELAGIWDPTTRARVAQAFAASRLSYAPGVFADVEASLDRWTADWIEARETACRGAMVEKSHSVSEMSRAAVCLDRRLQQLGGIVGVLGEADDTVVEGAERIVDDLPDLTPCVVGRGDRTPPSPTSLHRRGELLDIERRIAQASALVSAGRHDEAADLGRATLEASRAVGDDPLVARALALLGNLAQIEARQDESERLLRESILASERAGDELLTIETSLSLAFGLGIYRARPGEAAYVVDRCEARLAKHGDLPLWQGRIAYIRGRILEARGDHEDALQSFVRAVSLYERAVGENDLRTVTAVNNVGVAHDRLGHYEEALRHYERTLEARSARYGDDHHHVANALGNVGATYDSLGLHAEAVEPLRRSIATYTRVFGNDHRLVAWYRANLGVALGHLGRHEEARSELEAALQIRTRVLGSTHPHTAMAHAELAEALVDLGQGEEALRSADMAISLLAEWPDRSILGNARHARGRALHLLGRDRSEVEEELDDAILLLESALGRDHVRTTDARLTLAAAALSWDDLDLAGEQARRAATILDAAQVMDARRAPARALVAEIHAASRGHR